MCSDEEMYLTTAEVAVRLKLKPKTLQNLMSEGVFQLGVHYFKRRGIGKRFKWSAVKAWLENGDPKEPKGMVRMTRGYPMANLLTQ